jgi:DNA-directed RNA polymerase subunit omega
LASKRARQINSYYNQLGEGMGMVVPPQVASISGKPLTIAFEEIAASKATYHRAEPGDEVPEGEQAGDEASEAYGAEVAPQSTVIDETPADGTGTGDLVTGSVAQSGDGGDPESHTSE